MRMRIRIKVTKMMRILVDSDVIPQHCKIRNKSLNLSTIQGVLSKLKSCEMLSDLIPSINNFVWFSFRNCEGRFYNEILVRTFRRPLPQFSGHLGNSLLSWCFVSHKLDKG